MKATRILITTAAIATSALGFQQSATAGEITAKAVRVTESRQIDLVKNPKKLSSLISFSNRLSVRIRLSGDDVAKVTRSGKMKLKTAKDDTGTKLRQRFNYRLFAKKLFRINRPAPSRDGQEMPLTEYDIEIGLTNPARSAKSIAELSGEITVRIATIKEIDIPLTDLTGKAGKTIENAELKKRNITAALKNFSLSARTASMRLEFTGDGWDSVIAIHLIDAKGKRVDRYSTTSGLFRTVTSMTNQYGKVSDDLSLRIQVETDYKDVVVPIRLQDIPLP